MISRSKIIHQPPRSSKRSTDDIVRAIAVTTVYEDRQVLKGIDLAIRQGEVFVIMGPSGCGKTTMLRHLCGLAEPSMGSVFVSGKDIYNLPEAQLRELRLRTGLSFQGGALMGSLTVLENVSLPLRENTNLSDSLIRQIARMKLDMVDMLHAQDLLPANLSGGMKKRAAIARAIALDPDIVFLDEPSAGLDPITAAGVDNLICKLNQVFGITMIVVTHDLESAHCIADRAVMLLEGKPLVMGTRDEVWGSQDKRVQDFLKRRMPEQSKAAMDITKLISI